jgi:hypothetical protein
MNQQHDRFRRKQRREKGNSVSNIENPVERPFVPKEEPSGPQVDCESPPSPSNDDAVHHFIAFRRAYSTWVGTEDCDVMPITHPPTSLFKEIDFGSPGLWVTNATPIQRQDLDWRILPHHDPHVSSLAIVRERSNLWEARIMVTAQGHSALK